MILSSRMAPPALAVCALLAWCGPTLAQTAPAATPAPAATAQAPLSRADVERIVRETLLKNPEILTEAMQELERRSNAAEEQRRVAALATHRTALINSPGSIVFGNPQGDVTLVEFFDYNCGYCKRALTDMLEMMKSDPKLRIVLKDFPVLGPSSLEAAKLALAVKQQASPAKFFEFHQKLLLTRGEVSSPRVLALAKELGLDTARITKDAESAEVVATLQENFKIAQDLGLSGTPSFVIGDGVIIGAVGLAKLRDQVATTRANCKASSC